MRDLQGQQGTEAARTRSEVLLLINPMWVKINTIYYQSNYFTQMAFIHKPDQLKMHQKSHQKELMASEGKSKRRLGSIT